jgi:MoaA/NifB/PqqE/SkfB family radical SAM enzyme
MATVKNILAEGREAGYRHLHITGGEPLLWPGLFEAMDAASAMGYRTVYLNTNGTVLTREAAGRLAGHGGLCLSVSLEGPEALHDRFRGEGAHRRAVSGIENALQAGLDLVVFTLAGRSLLPVLPRFADDLFQRFPGIRYLTLIQIINVEGGAFPLSAELPGPEEFLVLVQTVALMNLYGLPTRVKNNTLAWAVSQLMGMPWIPRVHPLHREGNLIVRANGLISLSHSSSGTFGRYQPGRIQEALSSDAYRRAVRPDESICPSCRHVDVCKSYRVVRPSDRNVAPFREEPFCRAVMDVVRDRQDPQQPVDMQKQGKEKTDERFETQQEKGLCGLHGGC